MTQKMVIKVSMIGPKSRTKAMKIAAGFPGVDSAALSGEDKSQIMITGDRVDAVQLTILLRKNVGYAEVISVEEKKEEKEADTSKLAQQWPFVGGETHIYEPPPYYQYSYSEPYSCSIL